MESGRGASPGRLGTSPVAWNRKKPRARTWTLEDLDRATGYRLYFDPSSFRWEVVADGSSEPLVTRVHLNRRSRYDGDRGERTQPGGGGGEASEAPAPPAPGGSTPPAPPYGNAD